MNGIKKSDIVEIRKQKINSLTNFTYMFDRLHQQTEIRIKAEKRISFLKGFSIGIFSAIILMAIFFIFVKNR